jgi:hypothetical protein
VSKAAEEVKKVIPPPVQQVQEQPAPVQTQSLDNLPK